MSMEYPLAGSLDCSGQLCPVPILMTEEKVKELKKYDILEVIFTDPGAKPDLEAWCAATDNSLLKINTDRGKIFAYVQKR